MPDDLGEIEDRLRKRILGFNPGERVKISDGFDGWITTMVERVEKKDGQRWYKCEGIFRLFPESMLKAA